LGEHLSNIYSYDLVNTFWHFSRNPRQREVYNIGGGYHGNYFILGEIEITSDISGKDLQYTISDTN
jgi:hypothetical protein